MEYLAFFISENASFFNSYGNWLMIPLFAIVIFTDWLLSKKTFTSRLKKWALRTPLFILSVVLGALIYMTNFPLKPIVSSIAKVHKNIGQKVYDFDFIDVRKDSTYKISDFAGKVILLNFWGTYCPPCIEEFPHLKRIESDHPDKVWVIALSDENRERIMKFVQKIESPTIVGSFASEKWIDLETFRPLTVIIDKNGIIREYMIGKKDYTSFKSVIDKYL
ncbi:TlpA family protein disulfide reductase [candidate division KSB1 bacterium]|nr:TlpA family protein disulfide reductase [candidate division KSB1 bacterium]